MSIESSRRAIVGKNWRIPFHFFYDVLAAAMHQGRSAKQETGLYPNRFMLFVSSEDRRQRADFENVFIDELKLELTLLARKEPGFPLGDVRLELHDSSQLAANRVRLECYNNEAFLFGTVKEWHGSAEHSEVIESEWQGTELLARQSQGDAPLILIVDDEPVLCAVLQRMLTKLRYQVVTANNGLEALRVLSHMQVDLVISDLRMPKMDGWELMQRIKRDTPELPVVLITGYHSIYSRGMADASPADGYISKPFSFLEIKNLLEKLLEGKTGAPAGNSKKRAL